MEHEFIYLYAVSIVALKEGMVHNKLNSGYLTKKEILQDIVKIQEKYTKEFRDSIVLVNCNIAVNKTNLPMKNDIDYLEFNANYNFESLKNSFIKDFAKKYFPYMVLSPMNCPDNL